MPPRDEQDYETRRQQIIDGALSVFASKGFEKATNKDIARAAKIGSPGLIYHYFKDKNDLFRQVLQERALILQLLNHPEELMGKPPREALTLFGDALMKTFESPTAVSLLKLVLGESIRHPAVAEMFVKVGPGRGFALLTHYLSSQMDAGVLRRVDPGIAARCFIGPFLAYVLSKEVLRLPDADTLDPQAMMNTTIDIFLQGMQPELED